ncbi:DUF4236 domain-containing protein [Mycobacteroides abscessus]|uniref:DUF4236 domain-containing protein n=1 Tax=Mycobacteroides abscessus TaxID=36809 RepID=UPI000C25A719|nr:DUF4236 domain-containing protein [Mycobacteroides abscessus]
MGFYIRKSIKAGPFRFNLSKSGIGVSAGVPGFRVGTGPRGNYVHMGRGGVYYRATLGGSAPRQVGVYSPSPQWLPAEVRPSGIVMEDVTGSTAMELAPTGGGDIVEQLNATAARTAWGWWAAAASILLGLVTMPFGLILWIILAPVCVWLVLNDRAHKTVVLFYDVNDEHHIWFDQLATSWAWLTGSQRIWRIMQSGAVITTYQFKTNAGAGHVVNRLALRASTTGPTQLSTNIAVPSVVAGNAGLYFLPDRVLIREGKHFSDIGYANLQIDAGVKRFIEDNAPPADALQVDRTWQYVNVKGGPDRRYKNNRMLPIMLYGTIDLASRQGLHWQLQVSRKDAATPVCRALSNAPALTAAAPVVNPPAKIPAPPTPHPPRSTAFVPNPVEPHSLVPAPAAQPRSKQSQKRSTQPPPSPTITCAQLTRKPTPYPLDGLMFTAIDIETTGLDPQSDRIVEIGLVKFTADGTIVDEFATLINNPGSSPGAQAVHGITDTDLVGAPDTEQALTEAFAFMAGTVLVAHNLEFESDFLLAAAQRAGLRLPRNTLGLCTLGTARRQLDGRAFSLTVMYKTATGRWIDHQHNALADARAVRDVLLWLLDQSPTPLHLNMAPPSQAESAVPVEQCQISCRPVPLVRASVAELLDAFPQSPTPRRGDPAEVDTYRNLLADAVEDGRLSYEEADSLTKHARLTRLTGTQLRALHQQAWDNTYPDAKTADWTSFTPTQRREMFLLADALGLTTLADTIHQVIEECSEPTPPEHARYLRHLRVAIVGDDTSITDLREHAESYGAKLAVKITKTVQWMATLTPDSSDSRHTTARALGIPLINPAQGWIQINEAIREVEMKAFERQQQIAAAQALREQRAAEADAYWRPTWRHVELDHDPGPQAWDE